LVSFRDARMKRKLVDRILEDYGGDTLTALSSLIADGQHINYVKSAYGQLTDKAQEAFLYTSMLYRFNILMPASFLRRLVSADWEAFNRDVLEVDCKGILIQEVNTSTGVQPDLYFRSKHPIISDMLVKHLLVNDDRRFEAYLDMLRHLPMGYGNSTLLVNVLKALRDNDDLSLDKIDRLYDSAAQEFNEDPHFTLHYAINLQHRRVEPYLTDAIAKIRYVEGLLERRNHRLIHRRASLNFDLAKLAFQREKELDDTLRYVDEARDLFQIKLRLDPFSSFSYVDFVRLEVWCLDKIEMDKEERARQMIKIEDLLEEAERSVFDDLEAVVKVKGEYLRNHKQVRPEDRKQYLAYLESVCADERIRHLGLILMFYLYLGDKDEAKCASLVKDLEAYSFYDDVAKVLFKYYGTRLHLADHRASLFKVLRENPKVAERDPINYHYFSYVAAAYNRHFDESLQHVGELRAVCLSSSPFYRDSWRDPNSGKPMEFQGVLQSGPGKRLKVKVIDLQQSFGFQVGAGLNIPMVSGSTCRLILRFYLTGIRAEILGP
jgi:hypothetical protein